MLRSLVGSEMCIRDRTYIVTVTDNQNCQDSFSFTVTEPTELTTSIAQVSGITCFGDANGVANVTPAGGTPSYTYNWSNGSNFATATNLAPGQTTVTITDANGCEVDASITFIDPEELLITGTGTGVLCAGDMNGSIIAACLLYTSPSPRDS